MIEIYSSLKNWLKTNPKEFVESVFFLAGTFAFLWVIIYIFNQINN
jgi:hypothetical protein